LATGLVRVVGQAGGGVGDAHAVQRAGGVGGGGGPGEAEVDDEDLGDLLADREDGVERAGGVLEEDADVGARSGGVAEGGEGDGSGRRGGGEEAGDGERQVDLPEPESPMTARRRPFPARG
jgi:hypothetical protein